jgi:phosphatidylserine/phosphatidylglycerophosphate/cardiolipin synthase-like enzyme
MLRTAGLLLCAIVAVEFAMSPRTFHRMREFAPEVHSPAIYFAPQQDLSIVDRQIVRSAKRSLEIAMYSFTDRRIAEELVDACNRGVVVELYRDRSQYEEETARGSAVSAILHRCSDVHIRVKGSKELMHEKTYVADGLVLREGSANWSVSAARYQDNQVSITRDTAAIEAFSDDFAGMWQRDDNSIIQ